MIIDLLTILIIQLLSISIYLLSDLCFYIVGHRYSITTSTICLVFGSTQIFFIDLIVQPYRLLHFLDKFILTDPIQLFIPSISSLSFIPSPILFMIINYILLLFDSFLIFNIHRLIINSLITNIHKINNIFPNYDLFTISSITITTTHPISI